MTVLLTWDGEFDDPNNDLPLPVPIPNIIMDVLSGGNRNVVTAANGDVQADWAPAVGSSWIVISGSARPSTQISGTIQKIVVDSGEENGQVLATIGAVPGSLNSGFNDSGLVFRYVDANNYWALSYLAGTGMVLRKWVGGVATLMGSVAGNPVVGTVLKVTFDGDNIAALVGSSPINVTDPAHASASKHGLACRYTSASPNAIKISYFECRGHAEIQA